MDKFWFGLLAGAVGVLVIMLLIRKSRSGDSAKPNGADIAPVAQATIPTSFQGVPPEVVAAITGAIAAMWEGENGFRVLHIKRIHHAPAWNRAGREEQIYSRL